MRDGNPSCPYAGAYSPNTAYMISIIYMISMHPYLILLDFSFLRNINLVI